MVEVDEIGQVVDPRPVERHASAPALTNRFQVWTVREQLGVAVHANLGRGNPRKGRSLYRDVTISTINPVISDVMFVAKLDGLSARNIGSCRIR